MAEKHAKVVEDSSAGGSHAVPVTQDVPDEQDAVAPAAPAVERRPRGRKADPQGRDKLLQAAAIAFMERGYSGTSIDDIAGVLGATKGYVYHHCTSKSELYFAVQESSMRRIDAVVRPVFESELPTERKFESMACEHVMAVLTYFPAAKVAVQGLERGLMKSAGVQERRELRRNIRMRDDYESMFAAVVARGVAEGVFRDAPVGLLTKGALGTLNWVTMWFDPARATTPPQMKKIAEELATFAIQGLRR